jgi:hypothetical protein
MNGYEDCHGTYGGVQYGEHLLLLARSPTHLLAWVPGHAYWASRQQQYGNASLMLIARNNAHGLSRDYTRLLEGGRLSKARIMECSKAIDAAFGPGTARRLADRHGRAGSGTLLVDGGGDALTASHRAMKREREAANPQPKPPKVEQIGWTQAQVDRLMDACRAQLEGANDEEGRALWRKLGVLRSRFDPMPKRKPFTPPKDIHL